MRKACLVLLLAACTLLAGADDFKVIKLEQDVRNLERQVQDLSRQMADLQQRSSRSGERIPPTPGPTTAPSQPSSTQWRAAQGPSRNRASKAGVEVAAAYLPPATAQPLEVARNRDGSCFSIRQARCYAPAETTTSHQEKRCPRQAFLRSAARTSCRC